MITTNTAADIERGPHAARLAEELAAAGKLTDPRLAEAVRTTPRHVFVPTYHQQAVDGSWAERAGADDLAAVYANTALITALAPTAQGGTTVLSSSSQPGLMTRMIEALHLADGMRVLEIGTGYNAALLAHRLGDDKVFSVDVEADLVELARQRLAALGCHRPSSPATVPRACPSTDRSMRSSPPAPSRRFHGLGSSRSSPAE